LSETEGTTSGLIGQGYLIYLLAMLFGKSCVYVLSGGQSAKACEQGTNSKA